MIKTKVFKGKNPRKPWTARYWIPAEPKPEQHDKSFKLKSEANAFAIEMDAKIKSGAYARKSAETFGDAANRWLAIWPGADSTKSGYRAKVKNALGPWLNRPLSEVARDRAALHALCVARNDGAVLRGILTSICDMAVAEGTLASHRLAGMRLPDKSSKRRKLIPATHAQLQIIADALGERLGLAVWIMRGTGVRPGECIALRSGDFRPGWLRVSRKVYKGRVESFLKDRKESDPPRDTPVPDWLAEMVAEHIAKYGEGPLFPGRWKRREYISGATLNELFIEGVKRAGLPTGNPGNDKNFSPHMLRHIWATALRHQRVPIEDIADWGGWRDIQTLLLIYADQLPEAGDEGRAAMARDWQEFIAA